MRILIAPDKFKGSLSASEVCEAIASGLRLLNSSLTIQSLPMADGGEGTCELLIAASQGTKRMIKVADPLFREVDSYYGISGDGNSAFIEMAKASGLQWLKSEERNPLRTTTFGTGQMIADALSAGVNQIILGIGGSATNDAGTGMASALGYEFLDQHGHPFVPVGGTLLNWEGLHTHQLNPALATVRTTILCDVDNPLHGPQGAVYVFGRQKGGQPESLAFLDQGLKHFEVQVRKHFGKSVDFPGAGAGGGIGAGACIFLGARISGGFEFISDFIDLESAVAISDLVITGEGKIDKQSLSGKVVSGVAHLAHRHDKPCIAIAGQVDISKEDIDDLHLKEVVALVNPGESPEEAVRSAFVRLEQKTYSGVAKWMKDR